MEPYGPGACYRYLVLDLCTRRMVSPARSDLKSYQDLYVRKISILPRNPSTKRKSERTDAKRTSPASEIYAVYAQLTVQTSPE